MLQEEQIQPSAKQEEFIETTEELKAAQEQTAAEERPRWRQVLGSFEGGREIQLSGLRSKPGALCSGEVEHLSGGRPSGAGDRSGDGEDVPELSV